MLKSLARFSVDCELPVMKNSNQTTPTQSNMVNPSEALHKEQSAAPPEPSTKPDQVAEQQVGVVANTNKPQGKYYLFPTRNARCLGYRCYSHCSRD